MVNRAWGGRTALGHRHRLRGARWGGKGGYKAPEDYTKPQNIIQSPNTQYKPPTDYTKITKYETKPKNIRQRLEILNKSSNNFESNISFHIYNTKNDIYDL